MQHTTFLAPEPCCTGEVDFEVYFIIESKTPCRRAIFVLQDHHLNKPVRGLLGNITY